MFYVARPISEAEVIRLTDTMKAQRVALPFDRAEIGEGMQKFRNCEEIESWRFPLAQEHGLSGEESLPLFFRYIINIEIADVYRGTTWEDTCIAELWPDYGSAGEIHVSEDRRSLVMVTDAGESIETYYPFTSVLTLVETGPEKTWAIVIKEPAYQDEGRVETEYAVVQVPAGRDMTEEIFGKTPVMAMELLPTGFLKDDGEVYVEYEDFAAGETRRVQCELYR
jgi:hypothetical protein